MFSGNNLLHITGMSVSLVCFLHCIAFFLGYFGFFSINFMMLNILNNQIIHDLFVIFGIFFGTLIYISNTKKKFYKSSKFIGKVCFFATSCLIISLFINKFAAEVFIALGATSLILIHILEISKKKITL